MQLNSVVLMRSFRSIKILKFLSSWSFGELAGIRTLDLLIKSQLLYRLSYKLSPSA